MAIPMKRKTGLEVVRALEIIFHSNGRTPPKRVQTDRGLEFLNEHVKKYLKKHGVELWLTFNPETKASIVERFNKSLKQAMFRYFTRNKTKRYIEILPKLVKTYNSTVHSSIRMAPADVGPTDIVRLRQILYPKIARRRRKTLLYKKGDIVRISKTRQTFRKGYLAGWSKELYKISKVYRKNRPVYLLETIEEGTRLPGKYYGEEIQKFDTT